MVDDTTIRVSGGVADELHARKKRGESYDDVLRRLLWDGSTESREEPPAHPRDSGGETQVEWVSYQLQKAGVEFPGGVDRTDGELAVSGAFGYLASGGEATKGQMVLAVMPDHPLGYDVDAAHAKIEGGERYRGAWWRRVVKPGLEALPGVEKPTGGRSEWRYTGR